MLKWVMMNNKEIFNSSFAITNSFFKREDSNYTDLLQFKQEMERSGNDIHPYELHVRSSNTYRCVFFSFCILFLLLAVVLYSQRGASPFCMMLFGNCIQVKLYLSIFCGVLSAAAFGFAWQIRPEREAISKIVERTKRRLTHSYINQCAGKGWKRFMLCTHTTLLRIAYRHALDKVKEKKETTLVLLQQISSAEKVDPIQRVRLFNQAILELRDHLETIKI